MYAPPPRLAIDEKVMYFGGWKPDVRAFKQATKDRACQRPSGILLDGIRLTKAGSEECGMQLNRERRCRAYIIAA